MLALQRMWPAVVISFTLLRGRIWILGQTCFEIDWPTDWYLLMRVVVRVDCPASYLVFSAPPQIVNLCLSIYPRAIPS